MHLIHLTDEDQLQNLVVRSQEKPQVIFKYNPYSDVSEIIFHRLQKNCCPDQIDFYFLDIIFYKNISDKVAEYFHVIHQAPQILLISNGECIFEESKDISLTEIIEHVSHIAV